MKLTFHINFLKHGSQETLVGSSRVIVIRNFTGIFLSFLYRKLKNKITFLKDPELKILFFLQTNAQDYEVQNIECSFGEVSVENNRRINQIMSAQLRKPEEFLGSPIFADDR